MKPPDTELDVLLKDSLRSYIDSVDEKNLPEHEFSARFERKMEQLTETQYRREHRPKAVRIVRKAAVIVLVCCAVAFSGLMTVEAFREKVLSFFTQVFPTYTELEISAEGYEDGELVPLKLGYIPEGMKEVYRSEDDWNVLVQYRNQQNFLIVSQRKFSDDSPWTIHLNTEDAETENIQINGYDIWVIKRTETIQMCWVLNNSYVIVSGDLPREEMEKVVSNLR